MKLGAIELFVELLAQTVAKYAVDFYAKFHVYIIIRKSALQLMYRTSHVFFRPYKRFSVHPEYYNLLIHY